MRFLLTSLLVVAAIVWNSGVSIVSAEQAPILTADALNGASAILIDATTGQVLFEKNPHERLYPASITKIATGIYAIEKGNPDDIVTVSKKARHEEGTRVYLGEGEMVPLRKLEYGLLMNSGNDAATAIAEHMSGTTEKFAEDLNAYLREKTGMTETHFANAHGLHDPNHYTTASDMAKISQYAMKNPTFREIVGTVRLPWNGREWKTEIINHNKLLRDYPGATGIKNGFTDQAMHTLVGSAKRGDTELIAVTMKAASSPLAYKDVTKMLDYGFASFDTKQVVTAGAAYTEAAVPGNTATVRYTADENLYATVPKGQEPLIKLTSGGQLSIQAGSLQVSYSLRRHDPPAQAEPETTAASFSSNESHEHPYVRYAVLFIWLGLNLFLITCLIARARKRRQTRTREWQRRAS